MNEDASHWGTTTEAAEAHNQSNRLADAEIRDKLDGSQFSKRAHRRLDYLLSVAFSCIGIYNRRRALSLCRELQRSEAIGGGGGEGAVN